MRMGTTVTRMTERCDLVKFVSFLRLMMERNLRTLDMDMQWVPARVVSTVTSSSGQSEM